MQPSPEEQQVIDRLKEATNILVTVNSNPTVDQLAACLGLTLALNKIDKHATAVFSGEVPSTLEFLKPEDTLEKNTDSLRDFIISLDKSKADKLRYKVEDNVVKIFITPYRTAINESDFDYSQGDFNVEAVVALGVRNQQDLDTAITTHGRILHDATVISINTETGSELGSMNITDTNASSLSEIVTVLLQNMGGDIFDSQISTALLTGVVAETARFSNEKTTPTTMSVSSTLMTAGANQQLVATKLEKPAELNASNEQQANNENNQTDEHAGSSNDESPKEPGTLEIGHEEPADETAFNEPPEKPKVDQIDVDADGLIKLRNQTPLEEPSIIGDDKENRLLVDPPMVERSEFTANSKSEDELMGTDLTLPPIDTRPAISGQTVIQPLTPEEILEPQGHVSDTPIESLLPEEPKPFNLSEALASNAQGETPIDSMYLPTESEPQEHVDRSKETLAELEQDVASPHLNGVNNPSDLDSARRAVENAVADTPKQPSPVEALNAHTVDLGIEQEAPELPPSLPEPLIPPATLPEPTLPAPAAPEPLSSSVQFPEPPVAPVMDQPLQMPQPNYTPPVFNPAAVPAAPVFPQPAANDQFAAQPVAPQAQPQVFDPNAPPPVPPPMMPPSFGPPKQ